jgi:N utilization substance protein B
MGKRSTARRLAMQALYQADLSGIEIDEALKNISESEKFIPETLDFAGQLARTAWSAREKLDKIIEDLAIDWSLDRIGKVDRSVLRLALQELRLGETPASVVINEAVELAKKYSGEETAKFINGILGAYVRGKES